MKTFIAAVILFEMGILIGGIYLIKQLKKKQTRQPALSDKTIKNLKF
tara:strand:- start:1650 stop:1790 length:141 start_codon:yes stop_codon:yes gene_type:complete